MKTNKHRDTSPQTNWKLGALTSCSCTVVLLFSFGISGCGGDSRKPTTASVKPAANSNVQTAAKADTATTSKEAASKVAANGSHAAQEPAAPAAAPAGIGTLVGRVVLEGAPPVLNLLVPKGQESVRDAAVCAAHDIPDESLLVGEGNGVANVFVYLGGVPKGAAASAVPNQPVVFDQKGCRYVPHALVIRTQQPVLVKSDDAIQHNVRMAPSRNTSFNQIIPANERNGLELRYERPEREPMEVKCDIHPWMRAYLLPLDHQFAAVTDANGRFEIKDVPAGTHEFRIWHERPKYLDRKYQVVIKPGETNQVEIKFPAAKFASLDDRELRIAESKR